METLENFLPRVLSAKTRNLISRVVVPVGPDAWHETHPRKLSATPGSAAGSARGKKGLSSPFKKSILSLGEVEGGGNSQSDIFTGSEEVRADQPVSSWRGRAKVLRWI